MKKYLMLSSLTLLISCTTGELVRKEISPRMSKTEVIDALGNPDGYKIIDDQEILTYTNKLISGWSWDRADYYIILKNDKVIAYGAGEVRVKDNNTIVIIPIK